MNMQMTRRMKSLALKVWESFHKPEKINNEFIVITKKPHQLGCKMVY